MAEAETKYKILLNTYTIQNPPVDTPVENPVETPVDTTVDTPVETPAEQPAEQVDTITYSTDSKPVQTRDYKSVSEATTAAVQASTEANTSDDLPQTGDSKSLLSVLGLGTLALALFGMKKKEEN